MADPVEARDLTQNENVPQAPPRIPRRGLIGRQCPRKSFHSGNFIKNSSGHYPIITISVYRILSYQGGNAMKKILVVENYRPLRLLYQEELEKDGYKVSTAGNADNALEHALREDFDLIITEIRMPGKNGLDLMSELLARRADLRIIIHTAYECYKSEFMSWAADAYLLKSSCLLELKRTVRELLDRPVSTTVGPSEELLRVVMALPPVHVPT
jgi:CheY-like chemotaxis protein